MLNVRETNRVSSVNNSSSARTLMLRFESLGGTPHGCEFGFVQRAFAADHLGLLRWTAVRWDRLTTMIESRFEGVGDPAQTQVVLSEQAPEEYIAVDERYEMRTHTFVKRGNLSPGLMLEHMCLRQRFLRERLLGQLAKGNRIFVYRHFRRTLTTEELSRLHQALRSHGPGTLLYVRPAEPEEMPCRVVSTAPGLLVATLSHVAEPLSAWGTAPLKAEWLAVCRNAAALVAAPN
jgi:hypothetical protein